MDTVIDLAVGITTGAEVLKLVKPNDIRHVIPANETMRRLALSLGFVVSERPTGGDFLFSIHWPHLIPPSVLSTYGAAINVHPGYLPRARGMYPVFWAVFEGDPAGATVHHMVEKVDAGPILERVLVPYGCGSTGGEVWSEVSKVETCLALKYIDLMLGEGLPNPLSIDEPLGANRTLRDFIEMRDHPPLDEMQQSEIERLRLALTHPDYPLPSWAQ